MIKIKGLNKYFGSLHVLKDIDLEINAGEIFGLVGKSGVGKSTLLRCINGLERYQEGSLKVHDEEIRLKDKKEIQEFRKDVGMIFQQFSLIGRRTVYRNVALPLKCWGYPKENIDERVKELLELVDISEKIHDRPKTLSGGQQQRVAIARALALQPKVLLCDEATSALDPNMTKSVLGLLREINRRLGITIVVVTHQMEVVREVCDRIAIIKDGRIAEMGNVEEIFLRQPQALRELLGNEDDTFPEQGRSIAFITNQGESELISLLSRKYDEDIRIVSANREKYKEDVQIAYTISISSGLASNIIEELNVRNIHWEELTRNIS